MNTQKIVIGILVAIGIVALILWLVKKFGKSGNKITTPTPTATNTEQGNQRVYGVEKTFLDGQQSVGTFTTGGATQRKYSPGYVRYGSARVVNSPITPSAKVQGGNQSR